MLQAIANLGGWLLMMGQHDRSESLFYYFRIEDQVPENHLLRFIDRYVSFEFVVRSCAHPIAKRDDPRLIRKCCCESCCWVSLRHRQ
jgi:hypothetical protein